MFSDLSATSYEPTIDYATSDSNLPFADYVNRCRLLITERRTDLEEKNASHIIDTNSPFELLPKPSGSRAKYGALLIHGLLDSPFSLKDIGLHLQANGVHCRAILLPGHGTVPSDLIDISYQDWMQAVKYGIESFKNKVDKLFLIGYSTGAALAVASAMQDPEIDGLVLLSPAIRIKAPVNIVVGWHYLLKRIGKNNNHWVYLDRETDYAKYQSIGFNAVNQVAQLTRTLHELKKQQKLHTPIFMIISREDETISSHRAMDFFSSLNHPASKMLLYTAWEHLYPDKRIHTRQSYYPDLNIKHFSHISLPFAPDNAHYGQLGDYLNATRPGTNSYWYGAYNRIEIDIYNALHRVGIVRHKRRELTFNPDFDFMSDCIYQFLSTK